MLGFMRLFLFLGAARGIIILCSTYNARFAQITALSHNWSLVIIISIRWSL